MFGCCLCVDWIAGTDAHRNIGGMHRGKKRSGDTVADGKVIVTRRLEDQDVDIWA
jgi:hypothetical protein